MKKKRAYLIIIFLIVACFVAFGRIVGNDFINFDDPRLITENIHIQNGINMESIKWALSDSHTEYWNPLTWFFIILNWQLFGSNASGHHLASLLLHIGATLFLFLFLNKATKNLWPSAFAAAIFALHPLRVESVAWASELKDVLSMFFGMAMFYAYAYYVEKPRISKYLFCLILFSLSIMSKPMMVTLPFVLLLLDYWPLQRWQNKWSTAHMPVGKNDLWTRENDSRLLVNDTVEKKACQHVKGHHPLTGSILWEKVPFFILTALSIGLTLWSQRTVIASLDGPPIGYRCLNAILSYQHYIVKFIYPVDLAVLYPYPVLISLWQVSVAAFLLLGISVAVIYISKKTPFLFVGWFWYLGTLIPVIGLFQVGHHAMADRYTYLPSIGIAIMLTWGVPLLFRSEDIRRRVLFPVGSAVIATLVFLSWMQCGYWENSITLFSHALRVTKDNFMAHQSIALLLSKEGKINEAIYHYSEAIRLNPTFAKVYNSRGTIYGKLNEHQLAVEAYNNRGTIYGKLKQYQLAMEDFNKVIQLNPNYAEAYNNKGSINYLIGQNQNAIHYYNKAITLKSDDAKIYINRGNAYNKMGQFQNAILDYSKAIQLKQDYVDAYTNRANIYLKRDNEKYGCLDAQKACELGNCKTLDSAKEKGYCR